MEWIENDDPYVLPEHDYYLIHIRSGDYLIACPEQDGWYSDGERYPHDQITHYCLIERPLQKWPILCNNI